MIKLKQLLVLPTMLLISLTVHAGKYPWLSLAEEVELDKIVELAMKNLESRTPLYSEAFQLLNSARLLPYGALEWQSDTIPQGPVLEKNIFHFFWSRPQFDAEMLEDGYVDCIHPFICCDDYSHGVSQHKTSENLLFNHFKNHINKLHSILGSERDLLHGSLPKEKEDKIPSYSEVFYLDYLTARSSGLRTVCWTLEKSPKRTFDEMIEFTLNQPIVFDIIGKSIAYKVSSPSTFKRFALIPFSKHLARTVAAELEEQKKGNCLTEMLCGWLFGRPEELMKSAKETLLSEIILGFLIHDANEDPGMLEHVSSAYELNRLIAHYDHFGIINELKQHDLLEISFDRFLSHLRSGANWFAAIRPELKHISERLGIDLL